MLDPFDFLGFSLNSYSSDENIVGTTQSMYDLLITVGVLGVLFSLCFIGLKLSFARPGKRAEALEELKWKALTAIALFSAPFLIGVVMKVVASLV